MHEYMLEAIVKRKAESHAWPGGYPIGYVTSDGEYLCADCVNDPTNPVHVAGEPADEWLIIGFDVLEEAPEDGSPINCGHCYKVLLQGDEADD